MFPVDSDTIPLWWFNGCTHNMLHPVSIPGERLLGSGRAEQLCKGPVNVYGQVVVLSDSY
jgi:hypothetical protein